MPTPFTLRKVFLRLQLCKEPSGHLELPNHKPQSKAPRKNNSQQSPGKHGHVPTSVSCPIATKELYKTSSWVTQLMIQCNYVTDLGYLCLGTQRSETIGTEGKLFPLL